MSEPYPMVGTVDRRAERRARLEAVRWNQTRRHWVRAGTTVCSFVLSMALLSGLFPLWNNMAHAHAAASTRTIVVPRPAASAAETDDTLPDTIVTVGDLALRTAEGTPVDEEETVSEQEIVPEEAVPEAEDETDTVLSDEAEPVAESDSATVEDPAPEADTASPQTEEPAVRTVYPVPTATDATFTLTDDLMQSAIKSQYAVVMDLETREILAERHSDVVINPASMTKVLTILVAAESLYQGGGVWDMNSLTASTKEVQDYCWSNGCSTAGFQIGEEVPVRDLFYGTILPSGADAAVMLAVYTAGSHEAFVEKMNAKLEELGIADTAHFTNCVGLYDEDHHCTARDMAVIMEAAMADPVCRRVLGAQTWQTTPTEAHPWGISLSNRFLRRVGNSDPVLTVAGAKTGYVRQSGNCAVSFARREDGHAYLCVTGKGPGSNQVIRDHAALYRMFCAG